MSISRHQAVGAYQRWKPTDFDDDDADAVAPPSPAAPGHERPARTAVPEAEAAAAAAAAIAELPPDLKLPTAEDIERMHEEIHAAAFAEGQQQGFAEGHAAGVEAGREQGYAEGQAQAHEEAARLGALANDLEQAFAGLDRDVAEELMALAIEMARQMVRRTLAEHPESILDTIRAALTQLPQANAHIRLHPEDLALVRTHLSEGPGGQTSHRLQEDPALGRGEFRIEVAGAQIDGTLETRWRRILESIGRERARWQVADDDGEARS